MKKILLSIALIYMLNTPLMAQGFSPYWYLIPETEPPMIAFCLSQPPSPQTCFALTPEILGALLEEHENEKNAEENKESI